MILSNVAVHRALDAGDIVIDPEPSPRLPSLAAPSSPFDTTAVNLRLSPFLSVCKTAQPLAFDLRKPGLPSLLDKVYEPLEMDPTDIILYPDLQIAQLVFELVEGQPRRNDSQYQGQRRPSGAQGTAAKHAGRR